MTRRFFGFAAALSLCGVLSLAWLHQVGVERIDALEEHRALRAKPNDWFFRQRAYPRGRIDYEAYGRALEQARVMHKRQPAKRAVSWRLAGPINVGGRIADIEMTSEGKIYAGAASGGVFLSEDEGQSWRPIFDDTANLSIGDLAIAPSDEAIVFAGTGEPNGGGGSLTYGGAGVFKSADGGETWRPAGLAETRHIGRVLVHPQDPETVYVAAMGRLFGANPERGVYRTRDGGANWEQVLYLAEDTGAIDLAMHPDRPDRIYAAMWQRARQPWGRNYGGPRCGLHRSDDGGATWTQLSAGLPAGDNVGRIGVAVAPSDPQTVYAIYADATGFFAGVFKSTDGGDNWSRVNDQALTDNYNSFGWWFGRIAVHPRDADVVFALGLDVYISQDGGESWREYSELAAENTAYNANDPSQRIHVDQHALCFQPGAPDRVLLGNDGGVYASSGDSLHWFKTDRMPITQFYTCEIDPSLPDRLYGGTQDNGTNLAPFGIVDQWFRVLGGDGMSVLVDPRDSGRFFASAQFGLVVEFLGYDINAGPANFEIIADEIINGDRVNWKAPLALDPNDPSAVYFGSHRLYRGVSGIASLQPISGDLTRGPGPGNLAYGTLTAIAVSPANNQVVYTGADDGSLWKTVNGGQSWIDVSAGLPQRWITALAAHPADADKVYASFSGYRWDEATPYLTVSDDGGQTWRDVTGNLPAAPINDVVIDPIDPTVLYVAADVGVFFSRDEGASWAGLGVGLPMVPVSDLDIHDDPHFLVAATYGRSMHRIDLDAVLAQPLALGSAFPEIRIAPSVDAGGADGAWLGVINPHGEPVAVELVAFSGEGEELARAELGALPARGRRWDALANLFPGVDDVAWVQAGGERSFHLIVELRGEETRSAYWASTPGQDAFTPHVAKSVNQFETVIASVNGDPAGLVHRIRRNGSGATADIVEHYAPYARMQRDVRHYFGDNLNDVNYAVLNADRPGPASMEAFATLPGRSRLAALDLNGQSGHTLRFVHIAADTQQFWTGMVYLNVGQDEAQVQERFYDADGGLLAARDTDPLPPEGKTTLLADHLGSDAPAGAAWAEIISDQPLIGYELFGSTAISPHDYFAGLQGVYNSGVILDFPHFQTSTTTWTGLAVVNVGDVAADIAFTAYDRSGVPLETQTLADVPPGAKTTRLVGDLFENPQTLTDGAWIRAEASGSRWSGFLLWGDRGVASRRFLAGLNAAVRE